MDNYEWHGAPGIAVIGMAGRFPGAKNIKEFWHNLVTATDVLTVFSDEELSRYVPTDLLARPGYVKAGYVLNDVDGFDASFFGYTPSEAQTIDPQQRLFLECCWEAFEDAGHVPGRERATGVFASITPSSYLPYDTARFPGNPSLFFEKLLGNDKDYAAARVSYKLNLNGPSFSVQSACSSSLVGICTACQSLLDFQCDMALAGGASIALPERTGYITSDEGGLSSDGRCHAFDHRASGMNYGNGVAVLLLKRVEDAVADGDHIYGVIRGFAVNNDGSDKVGFVAPSVHGQQQVIQEALDNAGIDPASISCVETHGTGTPLGDPIELRALSAAYGTDGTPCALTSVKTNVGHLNSAAGAAGLVRILLSLEHKMLTPLMNYEKPNPELDLSHSRFFPNTETRPWDASPRRAGVSSFGLGGTNAHIIVEEAPATAKSSAARPWNLIPLSARSEAALKAQLVQLHDYAREHSELDIASMAYTLQAGRMAFPCRTFMVCKDRGDLLAQLDRCVNAQLPAYGRASDKERKVYFLFPGVGTQYVGMGRELYQEETVFRQAVDHCADLFAPLIQQDVRTVLHAEDNDAEATSALSNPVTGMAAMFTTEYALAQLWMSWGIRPAGCGGHSFGQYAAAVVCGVFSLEDAVRVVVRRASLMEKTLPGGMLMIFTSENTVQPLLYGTLSVAAINTEALCTVAGSPEDVDTLERHLTERRIRYRRLPVTRAGHSCLMEPVLEDFRTTMRSVPMQTPELPLLCNVTGGWISAAHAVSPDYWTSHIRQGVRFADNLTTLLQDPQAVLLEVGPGKALISFAKRHKSMTDSHVVASSLRGSNDTAMADGQKMREAYGQLFVAGVDCGWFKSDYAQGHPRRLALPTYPFEHKSFWHKEAASFQVTAASSTGGRGDMELMRKLMDKQKDRDKWFFTPIWKRDCLLAGLGGEALASLGGDWLIFVDTVGLGEAIASRLEQAGRRVARVSPGDSFARDGHAFHIRTDSGQDYVTLLQSLRREGFNPDHIVHAWSVTADAELGRGLNFYRQTQPLGYASLIHLVRALVAANMEQQPIRLGVVSNHLQSVTGSEILSPEKALVLGPCRVIPSEFLHMQAMSIDIETPQDRCPRAEVVDAIIGDVAAIPDSKPGESVSDAFSATTAYRGRHRWIQAFDHIRLPAVTVEQIPLREEGVYLITGGFGGVAYELSKHLAHTCRARLVLTGRTFIPPRDEWDAWLERHDVDDGTVRRILQIRVLEDAGAQVLPITADIADAEAMRQGWNEAVRVFGRIDGVFHAASMASSSMIQAQTEEKAYSVISPKVHGTLIIDELAADNVDFILLFSSISSHVGALGHTDYTAACLFMDTFAQMKSREYTKTRLVAVNWGYWDGVGIGVLLLPKLIELMGDDIPVQGILPAEGMQCIERILASPIEQVIVSTSDYSMLVKTFLDSTKKALTDYELFNAKNQYVERPQLSTIYVAPSNDVETVICHVWQDLFGINGIGINDTFIELGGDSLHALPMISRLEEIFRIKVPIRSLLEENTIAKLSSFLMRNENKQGQMLTIARIFLKVSNMSPDEVQKMLAAQKKA